MKMRMYSIEYVRIFYLAGTKFHLKIANFVV